MSQQTLNFISKTCREYIGRNAFSYLTVSTDSAKLSLCDNKREAFLQCVSFEAHFIYFKEDFKMQRKIMKKLLLVVAMVVLCLAVGMTASAQEFTENGFIYEVKDGNAVIVGCDSTVRGDVVIPSSLGGYVVAEIGEAAFKGNSVITGVVIPDSVLVVGWSAFEGCSNLNDVIIGDNVTTINFYAFKDCASLESVYIPDSVVNLYDKAFQNCNSLESVTLGNGIKKIWWGVFQNCTSLKSVVIPDSVTTIGNTAFLYCTSLTDVIIGKNVETIEYSAFESCTYLKNVTLHNTVKTIQWYTFKSCENLTDVYFCGTEKQWKNIAIDSDNKELSNANIHYLHDCGCDHIDAGDSSPETPTDECSCNCHKGGIVGFFFKIINFFNKLFKNNKECACGIAHY